MSSANEGDAAAKAAFAHDFLMKLSLPLDEGASAMDAESERMVHTALARAI